MKTAVFTIICHNYTAQAKTLFQSLQEHEPDWDRFVLNLDQELNTPLISASEATCLTPKELSLPHPDLFFLQYSIIEASTAVKPWAVEHLFERGYEAVIYLDPDIKVYSPMEELHQALDHHDLILTPHSLRPYPDEQYPNECIIRLSGIFNLGFAAFSRSENARAALRWWQLKLLHNCRVALSEGVFVDQSWMDFAPHYFDAHSLIEPGYNVAYWNLHERRIDGDEPSGADVPRVNEKPLRFMHFSGYQPSNPRELSKHQTRFKWDDLSKEVRGLLEDYGDCLRKNGYEISSQIPPQKTGVEIKIPHFLWPTLFQPDFVNLWKGKNVSRTEFASVTIRYLTQADPDYKNLPLFLGRFYAARGDFQITFPVRDAGIRLNEFLIWFESRGRREGGFDKAFPVFGWWTRGLGIFTLAQMAMHRLLFAIGLD